MLPDCLFLAEGNSLLEHVKTLTFQPPAVKNLLVESHESWKKPKDPKRSLSILHGFQILLNNNNNMEGMYKAMKTRKTHKQVAIAINPSTGASMKSTFCDSCSTIVFSTNCFWNHFAPLCFLFLVLLTLFWFEHEWTLAIICSILGGAVVSFCHVMVQQNAFLFRVMFTQPRTPPRCDTTGHTVENMVIKLAPTRSLGEGICVRLNWAMESCLFNGDPTHSRILYIIPA